MAQQHKIYIIVLGLLFSVLTSCERTAPNNDYLILFTDTLTDQTGYKNQHGGIIVPPGKYTVCFTDTFRTYAIVLKPSVGFAAIDRQENILYQVFPFDNGPDQAADGFFRIVENNKIGFAGAATGKIVIRPQFKCAWPFKNGTAKVSNECEIKSDGEHSAWSSNNWYYIDRTGRTVPAPDTTK